MGQCCSASLLVQKTNVFSNDVRPTFELLNSLMETILTSTATGATVEVLAFYYRILNMSSFSQVFYRPPTKLWEGNVFSRVCESVQGRKEGEFLYRAPAMPPPVSFVQGPAPPKHVQTCSKLDIIVYGITPIPKTCSNLSTTKHRLLGSGRLAFN